MSNGELSKLEGTVDDSTALTPGQLVRPASELAPADVMPETEIDREFKRWASTCTEVLNLLSGVIAHVNRDRQMEIRRTLARVRQMHDELTGAHDPCDSVTATNG